LSYESADLFLIEHALGTGDVWHPPPSLAGLVEFAEPSTVVVLVFVVCLFSEELYYFSVVVPA